MTQIDQICVVDVNVAIVANGAEVSLECQLECVETLEYLIRSGRVALDDGELIWSEYLNHLDMSGEPGMGDAFLRWIHENQWSNSRCETVPITPLDGDPFFDEFPRDGTLATFDQSDRKYVAVAVAAAQLLGPAVILNATDSDWKYHHVALANNGIAVVNLCPQDLKD